MELTGCECCLASLFYELVFSVVDVSWIDISRCFILQSKRKLFSLILVLWRSPGRTDVQLLWCWGHLKLCHVGVPGSVLVVTSAYDCGASVRQWQSVPLQPSASGRCSRDWPGWCMPLLAIAAEKGLLALAVALSAWGRDEGEERLVLLLPCHVCLNISTLQKQKGKKKKKSENER